MQPLFAARLNSFAARPELYWGDQRKPSTAECLERAASVESLDTVDLNYPDQVEGLPPGALRQMLGRLTLNGFAMRYYGDPAYRAGAFTHADPAVRQRAIDLTKRGVDALQEAGGRLMTLWLGQDGFDYAFGADHARLWDLELEGIRAVAEHAPGIDISLEYKPNEPRAFSMLPDAATTLLAIRELGLPNLGVTLDFAHVLYADEQPAYAAALVGRFSRLLGVHLNDGYGKRDDGLMVGAVHTLQTLELLREVRRQGYPGCLYFDTFPDSSGLDPVAECAANIATVRGMLGVLERLDAVPELEAAIARQDAVTAQRLVQRELLGA
ncbi:MAG: TIM barrel protein [Geminicoccaceae bacterium]